MKNILIIILSAVLLTACSSQSSENIETNKIPSVDIESSSLVATSAVIENTSEKSETEETTETSAQVIELTPVATTEAEPVIPKTSVSYDEVSQEAKDIVSNILYTKVLEQDITARQQYINQLQAVDEKQAGAWAAITGYWDGVWTPGFINPQILPDGLPQDDSLCIVVMGYQLNPDGSMLDELVGRLTTALACAEKYPNAYIDVTGGGTAELNPSATEADQMAQWLIEHGVSPERIIVENQSKTSADNALFSYRIFRDEYPQIKNIAIATSDYHVTTSCLLFQAQFYLAAFMNGDEQLNVISNAAFLSGASSYFSVEGQAKWLLRLFSIQ